MKPFRYLLVLSALSGACFAQADLHENPASPVNTGKKSATASKKSSSHASATSIGGESLSGQDKMFIREAAKAGRAEVSRAEMMVGHSTDPGVQEFAKKLAVDHTMGNADLGSVAQGKGVALPEDTSTPAKMKPMSDKSYVSSEVENHRKAIQLFEGEASMGLDKDIRNFASKALPILQGHLKMAKDMQSSASTSSKHSH